MSRVLPKWVTYHDTRASLFVESLGDGFGGGAGHEGHHGHGAQRNVAGSAEQEIQQRRKEGRVETVDSRQLRQHAVSHTLKRRKWMNVESFKFRKA